MTPCDLGSGECVPSARAHPVRLGGHASDPPQRCSVTLPARPAAAWAARAAVRAWAEALDVAPELVDDIEYVTSEAVSNSAEHAYPAEVTDGVITVTAEIVPVGQGRSARITVRDFGRWKPVDPDPSHRGHGLAAMVALATEITIRHHVDGGGTEITLVSPAANVDERRAARK